MARERGLKVGKLRLITAWPFPDKKIAEMAANVKAFVVPELNLGQMVREVERAAARAKRRHSPFPTRAAESTILTKSSTPSWRQADAEY